MLAQILYPVYDCPLKLYTKLPVPMSETLDDLIQTNPPCPNCGAELPKDEKTCPNCGVDLLLLTLLTERAYLDGLPGAAPISSTPEALIPRIGDYLLDHGLITQEQLDKALDHQQALAEKKDHRLLGQTLIDLGYIDHETLDLAINLQIIELHTALREANRNLEQRVDERTSELKSALARLSEANQIKANLISNISHELRTPLAHMKGYVELFTAGDLGDLTEGQLDAIRVMQRSTSRLESLIEDLIEYSTAARGGIALNLEPISIGELITSVLSRSISKAEDAGVKLKVSVDKDLPKLRADPARMEWVLFQLVDNGIKFTPFGGEVIVGAKMDGELVRVFVADTGVGMPTNRIEEAFIPFHQLDGSATRRHGGTGLGLALVKLILDSHRSEIEIESFKDKGSLISFNLPAQTENE
jgi:signal transduction histidine kinase